MHMLISTVFIDCIPAFAVYSGEYGIQYLTPQFGEDVICPCCFPYINFSRFLFWHLAFLQFFMVIGCGATGWYTPDKMNLFTTMLSHVRFQL